MADGCRHLNDISCCAEPVEPRQQRGVQIRRERGGSGDDIREGARWSYTLVCRLQRGLRNFLREKGDAPARSTMSNVTFSGRGCYQPRS